MHDECIHGLLPATCAICKGDESRRVTKGSRSSGSATELVTPAALEKYRSRYLGDREPTFDAYVDIFFRIDAARNFPGGWTKFSRCANGEPSLVEHERPLVERAEAIMQAAGYIKDDSGRPAQGRKWRKAST